MTNIESKSGNCNQSRLRIVKLFTFAKGQRPWKFETTLVHSVIAFRNRIGFHPTVVELERETRLNRRTVTKALQTLAACGVKKVGTGYLAERPEGTQDKTIGPYVYIGSKTDHWSDRIGYVRMILPNPGMSFPVRQRMTKVHPNDKDEWVPTQRRFTVTHAYLFSVLHSLLVQKHKAGDNVLTLNNGRIRALTGLDKKTVHEGIKILHAAKLIRVSNWDQSFSYELKCVGRPDENPVFSDNASSAVTAPVAETVVQPAAPPVEPVEFVEVAVSKMTPEEFNAVLNQNGLTGIRSKVGRNPTAEELWDRTLELGFNRQDFGQFIGYCEEQINVFGNDYTNVVEAMLGESGKMLGHQQSV